MSSAREALGSLATEELALAILRLLRVDPYVDSLTNKLRKLYSGLPRAEASWLESANCSQEG
jgi:hypothetical protein